MLIIVCKSEVKRVKTRNFEAVGGADFYTVVEGFLVDFGVLDFEILWG